MKKYKVTVDGAGTAIYTQNQFEACQPHFVLYIQEGKEIHIEPFEEPDETCQKCGALALVQVNGKTSDQCFMRHRHREYDGYVLRDMGVGEGDYLEFTFCTACGQIQGEWPKRVHPRIVTRETRGYPEEYKD